ncbi:MAG: inositol monophosphatase family protein [Candidatus Tantalella remota]|nr:inositol monophosphatase family protein [Candidatus Tantalella remota]
MYDKIMEVATKAARESGEYILGQLDKLKEVSCKAGDTHNLVTNVDKTSEKMIIESIMKEFPSHSILAEESGEKPAGDDFLWVIDPLDGTTNYTHAFPFFCVSIGVVVDGAVRAGVVYDPSRDEMFTAAEGKGAAVNGAPIRISEADKLERSLVGTGFAYDIAGKLDNVESFKMMLKHAQAVRRAGSAALDLCYVACGRFDGFWEMGLHPWDTAAGQIIVKEAGGRVSRIRGKEADIFKKDIVATNGKVHDEMLALFKNTLPA